MPVIKERCITKAEVAYAFDVDERTISRWQDRKDDPLPVFLRQKTRAGSLYDLRALMVWAQRQALSEISIGEDGKVYNYEAERARLTKAQADKTELEVKEIRGEVIRLPLVVQHWQGMVSSMRAKLLSLPTKVAAQTAAPEKLQYVTDMAQALVYEALSEIAGDAIPNDVRDRVAAQGRASSEDGGAATAETDVKPVGKREVDVKPRGQRRARKVSTH